MAQKLYCMHYQPALCGSHMNLFILSRVKVQPARLVADCTVVHPSTPQYTPVHPNKQNNCAVTELIALVIVWAHQASCQRWQEDVIHPIVHVQNSATRNMIFLVTMYVACMFTLPPLIPPTVLYKKITRSSSTSVVTMNNICTPIFWMKLWILPLLHPPLAQ